MHSPPGTLSLKTAGKFLFIIRLYESGKNRKFCPIGIHLGEFCLKGRAIGEAALVDDNVLDKFICVVRACPLFGDTGHV